jgi:two-component sensor histidine kinase
MDAEGKLREILCIGTDVTERRLAEIEVKKLLNEKEILLQEVHHRIKNNMNTIAGLLYLQSASADNDRAAEALKDAHGRVLGMMMIYDRLFRSSDFRSVNVRDYMPELIAGIVSTFPDFGNVAVETFIDDFILDTATMVPAGIIINELLTNSYKYAFPDRRGGKVDISFISTGVKSYEIIYKDNGVGIPDSIVAGVSGGFGLSLITLLAEQMHGSFEIVRGAGAMFRIKFQT